MNIATALISQLEYQSGWILFASQLQESQKLNQSIKDAVTRATHRFKERLGDSPTAIFILDTSLIQEALGRSIAAYIDEPYQPEKLMWKDLGINPEIVSKEQFNLGISILGEDIRQELLTIPEIRKFVETKQLIELERTTTELEKKTLDIYSSLNIEAGETLTEAINEAKFLLNADLLVLYSYNQLSGQWATKPIAIGSSLSGGNTVADWVINVLAKNKPLFLEPSDISGSFVKREKIASAIAIPLTFEKVKLGVLFANYRTHQDFTEKDRQKILGVAGKVSEALYQYLFSQLSLQIIEPDTLRVQLLLPKGITTSQFFQISQDNIHVIEQIYLVLSLIYSGNRKAIDRLISTINRNQGKEKNTPLAQIRAIVSGKKVDIQPPLLTSIKYGSPGSFDLLGIGKIFEILRDIIKDVKWHGRHENEIAELEREGKKLEIQRAKIENERAMVQTVSEKLVLLEKITDLELSKDDRNTIVSAILPQLVSIYDLNPTFLLEDRNMVRRKPK